MEEPLSLESFAAVIAQVKAIPHDPKNIERFRVLGNRMLTMLGAMEPISKQVLYEVVGIYHKWGCVAGGEAWLLFADHYRGILLKKLWQDFNLQQANGNKDEAKKCFVVICTLIDEIYDVKTLRELDSKIDLILKEYLSFARDCPGKAEPFEVVGKLKILQGVFKTACERKYWNDAEKSLSDIAMLVGINLDSPYESALFSDAKIKALLLPMVELGYAFWINGKREEALPLFENAARFILLLQHVTDEQWRTCGTGVYFCSKVHHDRNHDVSSFIACSRALRMLECIREKTQEDNNCIAMCKSTMESFLKVPKSPPPKPVDVSPLRLQQDLFDKACDNNNRAEAARALVDMGHCLDVEIFAPSAEVKISDKTILDIVKHLDMLSTLSSKDDEELTCLATACRWWNKLQQKSPEEWRNYISMLQRISGLYFEKQQYEKCIEIIQRIVEAHENIYGEENKEDIDVVIGACCDAADYCVKLKAAEQANEWNQKADYYRVDLITWLKSEVQRLLDQCEEESKEKAWEAMESAVYDAENTLAEIRTVVSSFVSPPDEGVLNYLDVQASVLALTLYRVFEAFLDKRDFREAESVLGQVITLLNKIRVRGDDAEFLFIECQVYGRAFGLMNDKKWKMQSALELARQTMPEADKNKKEEIMAKRKAKADAEKAAEEQKRQEEQQRRVRDKQERKAQADRKVAEEKAIKDAQEKYEKEKAEVKGYVRKFKKLEKNIDSDELEFFRERRRCLWNRARHLEKKKYLAASRRDVARDAVVLACEALVEACDTVMVCCGMVSGHSEKYFLNLSSAELVPLNEIFKRGAEFYEGGKQWNESQIHLKLFEKKTEWHKLEEALKASEETLQNLAPKSLRVKVIAKPPRGRTFATCTRIIFFPQIIKLSESSSSLVSRCQDLLNVLVQSRRASDFALFSKAEKELGDICEELFKRYPGFQDILDDEAHPLYGIMSILESCRFNFVKVNRVANTMPSSERVKEMCGKLHDRIEEVERLRNSRSL